MDEEPQEFEEEKSKDQQLEDELDQVLAAASSLVETLTDEVGTPEEEDEVVPPSVAPKSDPESGEPQKVEETPPPDPPTSDLESEEPDFMSELTQSQSASSSGTGTAPDAKAEPSHLGAGSSTVASPENLGVIGSANSGVSGTAKTTVPNDYLDEELRALEATPFAEENGEVAAGQRKGIESIIPRVTSIVGSVGVWLVALIAPLLDVIDRPVSGLSEPIRYAMGVLGLATLATAMVVFALSFW